MVKAPTPSPSPGPTKPKRRPATPMHWPDADESPLPSEPDHDDPA